MTSLHITYTLCPHTSMHHITAKANDPDDILDLLELVVGAAVMCDDKAVFIPKIFNLHEVSQAVLKGLVEQVMGRAVDLEDGAAAGNL